MLFKEELRIIELFRLAPFTELTLQEIMQKLGKKSYNWTYLAVQKLAKKGILDTRKIGKTIVAKLNLESKETITWLILLERQKTHKTKHKIIDDIKKITPFFVLLENKKGITAIVENKELKSKIKEKIKQTSNLKILTKQEFILLLTSAGENPAKNLVKDHLVLAGAEVYYEILLEAYRHGLR
ncbi:hypothetical protein JW851_04975 [Candidatus Woesearchaeota archaeon]|nr:hypothetical protein [Candidatus Woesearchaeota archaeon]